MLPSWSQIDFHLIYSAQNPARLLNYSKGTILTNTCPSLCLEICCKQHFITLYRFHLSISISEHQQASFTSKPYRVLFTQHFTHFAMNFTTMNSQLEIWTSEWTMTRVIDRVRHMVWTHVPIPSFNVHRVVQASFTARKYGPNSLNISLFCKQISWTFTLQWIHNWKEDTTQQVNDWVN